jgi:hypothetical protein
MNILWDYLWPIFSAGLLVGAVAGLVGFRPPRVRSRDRLAGDLDPAAPSRLRRLIALAIGIGLVLGTAALWHGPFGAADRLTNRIERNAQATLHFYELAGFSARLHRAPLTRRLILAGPGDNFQRTELVRTMETLPGVGRAQWTSAPAGVPLIAEAAAVGILGFLLGLLLAYLIELRRRYNAQWSW